MKGQRLTYDIVIRQRSILITIAVILLIFILRLFYLQILSDSYKESAKANAFYYKTLYPSRGLMYDRNGKLVVYNQPAYNLTVITREIVSPFDTVDFCRTLKITPLYFEKRLKEIKNKKLNPGYSPYTPQSFLAQISPLDYALLQEKMYKFPGFYIQQRTIREYMTHSAAHLLGSIGEVSPREMEKDLYYVMGDDIGKTGVEKFYEPILRGTKGVEILLRDSRGVIKGKYEEGIHDKDPISGANITLSIDMELQEYAEKLMTGKVGSVVAIEPSTGEILTMVSAPTYSPSLLIGRERGKNHRILEKDPLKPLFDRTMMATYPPGSTFKTVQALIFQQEKIITEQTAYPCAMGFPYGNRKLGCHSHPSPLQLSASIQHSCNAYYCYGLRAMLENRKKYNSMDQAFDTWKDHAVSMGFGYPLGVDLPGEKRGLIPNSKFYNKIYGKDRWRATTIISTSIGQGEILSTPIQMANLAALIGNKGYFFTPHIVKQIEGRPLDSVYTHRRESSIDRSYFGPIVEGMYLAVQSGTARGANMVSVEVCGKTGTAQNPHGKDHSIFICFAPKENPKIAMAIYVENAGFGATYAVPIASLLLHKYFQREFSADLQAKENFIVNTQITPYGIFQKE